ncbi:MAG: peptidoglycan DD-metalloendopeptidase family protein [Bacteroidota bacterium]
MQQVRAAYDHWLAEHKDDLISPVDFEPGEAVPVKLDLPHIIPDPKTAEVEMNWLHQELLGQCRSQGGRYGYGGYLEQRTVYSADSYISVENGEVRRRNLHLGFDFWTYEVGHPVCAPMAGTVHSLQDNAGHRDYGPTIILQHEPQPGLVFYTLYGHLTRDSLGLVPGQFIAAADAIGEIGSADVNGGWVPHLHFQVILDLGESRGDFPGVGYADERDRWAIRCPDPAVFFGLD